MEVITVLREVRIFGCLSRKLSCGISNAHTCFIVQVVDNVLKEPGQPDTVLYNRAKALILVGAIFKSTQPDESDEERRELERCDLPLLPPCLMLSLTLTALISLYRMVAEAAKTKPKKGSKFKGPHAHGATSSKVAEAATSGGNSPAV